MYERDGLKVTAFDADHGGLLQPAFGYRIDHQGSSVVLRRYRPSQNLVGFARDADVPIHELTVGLP